MTTIKDFRKNVKLSQSAVAWEIGVSPCAYSYLESGKTKFKFVHAIKLAKVFKCTLDDLAMIEPYASARLGELGELDNG